MVPAAQTLAEVHAVGVREKDVHQDDIELFPRMAQSVAARLCTDHLKILLTFQKIACGVADHGVIFHQQYADHPVSPPLFSHDLIYYSIPYFLHIYKGSIAMKQKWPILIFSTLLTAFIVLAGIWGNAQFEHLHSGSVLTAQHAAQGIALDGWRQEAPGQWHFTFTVGEDIPSLTLCVTNTAVPLAHENLTSLERSGELYALDVTPGETVELVFTCSRSPQTWLMTSAFASRAFRFRTMTQLIALTAFVTMGMVLLALYHYKHLPELGYFLLYLVIMSAWALMVFFFPAIRSSLLQRILRSFFSLTVLASALLAAGLLGVKLPRSGRGLLALAAGCVVFFALSTSSYPPLRVGMLVAGMCLCLYYLMAAVNADYEGAALMLLPGAVTTASGSGR